ncbi:MAG: cohesin domain-containing protein [Flammeovirgaceae bacterium]
MKISVTHSIKMLMLIVGVFITSSALAQINFQVENTPVDAGAIVEIPVTVRNFNNAAGIQLNLDYPTDKATFLGITNPHANLTGFAATNYNEITSGTIALIWLEPTLTPTTITDGAQLFTIQLQITAAQGETFEIDVNNVSAVDQGASPISATGTSGTILVNPLTFVVNDATVNAGATVDIPVTLKNFSDVAGFQYQIQYPTDKANFVSIDNFHPDLVGFSTNHYFSPEAGKVNVVWDEPALTNVSIADDAVLFTIKVQITANAGDVFPIDIVDVFAFDNQAIEKTAAAISGNITVVEFGEITGAVYLEDGTTAVGLVELTLAGSTSQTITNQNDGTYAFAALPYGDYTLTPAKEVNIVNGINVADILLVRRHILGLTPFNSPYKLIAADADFSDVVNVADIIVIRRLILQSQNTLAKSWRFVDSDYTFTDPANPFADAFENRSYTNLAGQQINQNFIGVKIGDVNNNNDPLQKTTGMDVELRLPLAKAFNGSTVKVPVLAKANYNDIAGWQGTIQFDEKVLVFKGYEPANLAVGQQNFFTDQANEGRVTFLYDQITGQGESYSADEALFNLVFEVIGDAGSVSTIEINSAQVPTAIYTSELAEGNNLRTSAGSIQVIDPEITVYPNPATAFKVDVLLPQEMEVKMSFTDLLGHEVKTTSTVADKGRHTLDLDATGLTQGVYLLKVTMGHVVYTQKLIVQ